MLKLEHGNEALTDGQTDGRTDGRTVTRTQFFCGGYNIIPRTFSSGGVLYYKKTIDSLLKCNTTNHIGRDFSMLNVILKSRTRKHFKPWLE